MALTACYTADVTVIAGCLAALMALGVRYNGRLTHCVRANRHRPNRGCRLGVHELAVRWVGGISLCRC